MLPSSIDVSRVRGDTYSEEYTISSSDTAWTIAGCSFRLTVDPSPDPADGTANLFSVVGTIASTSPGGGKVVFDISPVQANQLPDTYYYDLEMTDVAGKVRTVSRGKWSVSQDISK